MQAWKTRVRCFRASEDRWRGRAGWLKLLSALNLDVTPFFHSRSGPPSMAHILKRSLSTLIDAKGRSAPKDFSLFPNVFTMAQQRILLGMALEKLDAAESRQSRRRRNTFKQSMASSSLGDSPSDLFLPDEWYQMEEVHSSCSYPQSKVTICLNIRATTMGSLIATVACTFIDLPSANPSHNPHSQAKCISRHGQTMHD